MADHPIQHVERHCSGPNNIAIESWSRSSSTSSPAEAAPYQSTIHSTELSNSESKIDRIEARLANIERLLQERLPQTPHSSAAPARIPVRSDPVIEVDGYTGPHADSLAAKEAFEQVAGVSPAIASDESLRVALASLRGIIDRIKGEEDDSPASGLHATKLALPTWEEMTSILDRIESEFQRPAGVD